MKVQNGSFAMMASNYTNLGKGVNAANNAHAGKTNKTGNPNAASLSLSPNSQLDKMVEKIQEQIQKIQENDSYDADTKKSKIEKLENQLKEIEKTKSDQLTQSALGQKKKSESNSSNNNSNNNAKGKYEGDGAIFDLSSNAKALIEADTSLKNLKNAHSMKVKLEGSSNVLASEIKIDKGRGVDTAKKEEQLAKLKDGIENSFANMGETIKDVNKAAQDMSDSSTSTVGTSGEKHVDGNEKSVAATTNDSYNAQTEKATQEKSADKGKS